MIDMGEAGCGGGVVRSVGVSAGGGELGLLAFGEPTAATGGRMKSGTCVARGWLRRGGDESMAGAVLWPTVVFGQGRKVGYGGLRVR